MIPVTLSLTKICDVRMVKSLSRLEILRLNDNEFPSLDAVNTTQLGQLKHLKELDISRWRICSH